MMRWLRGMAPLALAGLIIVGALMFVRWFNAYEAPGDHWAPAAPVAHELARFSTDMGTPGDYRVQIEKLRSKFPLLFVEYQPPGPVLDAIVHSDDGIVRLDEQFADEGGYRISVQHVIHPGHREDIDFTVQTPLSKYFVDVALFALLLGGGYLSGRRLRALSMAAVALLLGGIACAPAAWAHGGHGQPAEALSAEDGELAIHWASGHAPRGPANRAPMDWRLKVLTHGHRVERAAYALDFVHLETGLPVLHLEGVTVNGEIPLHYSPPDGTDYQLFVRLIANGREHHLALDGAAEAIRPTPARQWASFLVLMTPALIGMAWGWKRGSAA